MMQLKGRNSVFRNWMRLKENYKIIQLLILNAHSVEFSFKCLHLFQKKDG